MTDISCAKCAAYEFRKFFGHKAKAPVVRREPVRVDIKQPRKEVNLILAHFLKGIVE